MAELNPDAASPAGMVRMPRPFARLQPALALAKQEVDRAGVPDVVHFFDHGVVRRSEWRPNESDALTRIDFHSRGVKGKKLRDTGGDELFDTLASFARSKPGSKRPRSANPSTQRTPSPTTPIPE